MTYDQALKEAIKKYPIYTKFRKGPEGEVDCNLTKYVKTAARKDYIKKLMNNAPAQT